MSTYKLIYFKARGRGEVCRFLFAQAGVDYEDKRLQYVVGGMSEEWAELKPTTPTGLLPVLEVDGKQLPGSGPIMRFLAERFGLAGSNDIEAAEIDGVHDVLMDFMTHFVRLYEAREADKKEGQIMKDIQETAIPRYWGVIEKRLQSNTSDWVYGVKPTYADFAIYCALEFVVKQFPDFLEKHPATAKLKAAVEALPRIAEWLKRRPETDM